ncbi:MAG: putative Ig domain-containing protein [Pirellulales bacterium]|nr:putative Ig domain-containing protein [Pirellulales bacterium]
MRRFHLVCILLLVGGFLFCAWDVAWAAAETRPILTPKPGPAPRINGPSVQGCRPGRPFLYRIPATGARPIEFSAQGLPEELALDPATGIITGTTPAAPGEYVLTLVAENAEGKAERPLKVIVGDRLALTPPMGWNSWYIHYNRVTEQHMRNAADAMIASGMADFGYQYVNCDDCWTKHRNDKPYRDAQGNLLTNAKFPDIKGMVDYIHSKGLKAGTYTSPGPWTCAGYVGAGGHEEQDAQKIAEWGFDFLKYDWCSYGSYEHNQDLKVLQKPYALMGNLLKQANRDIVLNLCQYGMGDVWKWGAEVGGHCWRTTHDLGLMAANQLPSFYHAGLSNARHWQYVKPGGWNDPDYILIGTVGDARTGGPGAATSLTPDEQYSYMSMWCLMASPLIFSGDMARLDEFTLNVLCNAEVLAVDQDSLGKQARIVRQNDDELVLAKPMEDGSLAVGLFNLSAKPREISASWTDLGLTGKQIPRDLWRQKDLGATEGDYRAEVPPHGVMLVRLRGVEK